jgi:hypothetical protein
MKKILLFLFVLSSTLSIKASDTLTVRQVFSFSVGDTFDYSHNITNYDLQIFTTWYYRTVISQKVISPGQDSIIYNGNWVITNLDSIAAFQIDTYYRDTMQWMTQTNFLDTTSFIFPGAISNDISSGFGEGGFSYKVTSGWGETYNQTSGIDNGGGSFNTETIQLIYFSNGIDHYGTPYYDYLGISNASADKVNIAVYPNPTSDQLHLSISGARLSNTQLIITDILGQEVYSSTITQSESTHDVSKLASGIYTWRVIDNNTIIKTGKVVKE